jgi:hypothetical protein
MKIIFISILAALPMFCTQISEAQEVNRPKNMKELTDQVNINSKQVGWHAYTQDDLKILIIANILKISNSDGFPDQIRRKRMLKLLNKILLNGELSAPVRVTEIYSDSCRFAEGTPDQADLNVGKFVSVNIEILDEAKEGEKLDWQTIPIFVKYEK